MNLPKAFTDNVISIWGTQGTQWLKDLPELVQFFATRWQLQEIIHFENLSYNYVARAYSNAYKAAVVLKIGIPTPDFLNELKALEWYDGNGCVKLLDYDLTKSGMLLASIQPGTTLHTLFPHQERKAIEHAAGVMNQLHARPVPTDLHFRGIDTWFSLFEMLKIPHQLKTPVKKARLLVDELQSTAHAHHLLHGDLHHDNILLDASGNRIAIDPKGVIGEAAYEVGAFMCNPMELSNQPNISDILALRLNLFADLLHIDRSRLAKACYARIILSACWTVQANGNWRDDVKFAQILLDI